MKPTLAACTAALLAAGCVAYPTEPSWETKYKIEKFKAEVQRIQPRYPDVDKGAQTLLTCDRLFPHTSQADSRRLCLLRGFDRYVDHQTPPISERYLNRDDQITIEVPRQEWHPAVPSVPGASGLIDCRVNPTPPCYQAPAYYPPHTYGGQPSHPSRP